MIERLPPPRQLSTLLIGSISGLSLMLACAGHVGKTATTESPAARLDARARRSGVVVLTSGRNGQRLTLDVVDVVEPGSAVAAFLRQRG